jgi:putative transposon-encoded protein
MKKLFENNVVCIKKELKAKIIGEDTNIDIPKNTIGTIVLVYKNKLQVSIAYEIEFYISEKEAFALATVDANDLKPYK